VSYLGCTFVGGIDRVVVAKRDTGRNVCVNVVMSSTSAQVPAGLTLPANLGFERATVSAASACPARALFAAQASGVTGTITQLAGSPGMPTSMSVAVQVTFPANDAGAASSEALNAQTVDVQPACQQ